MSKRNFTPAATKGYAAEPGAGCPTRRPATRATRRTSVVGGKAPAPPRLALWESATEFLKACVAHNAALGVRIKRLLTDNGSAYRSMLFNKTCQALGIKHTYTKPYRPLTDGKAERFIQACLREWAHGRTYANSTERTTWQPAFLAYYNARRPHSALGYKPPASRLGGNNLLQLNKC